MPKDRVTQMHQGYGFVEFMGEEDADYAIKIMNMIKLYGKPIRVNKASAHQKNLDVGANIFIGNLDPEVDEKLLYDTFSAFGVILQTPKVIIFFLSFCFYVIHTLNYWLIILFLFFNFSAKTKTEHRCLLLLSLLTLIFYLFYIY